MGYTLNMAKRMPFNGHYIWHVLALCTQPFNYYRPQTKFAKVMFSQVSVCPQGGLCPGGGVPVQGGLCLGRSLSGRPLSGGSLSRGDLCQADPRTVTCGRYASYWNAFLF